MMILCGLHAVLVTVNQICDQYYRDRGNKRVVTAALFLCLTDMKCLNMIVDYIITLTDRDFFVGVCVLMSYLH